MFKCFYPLKFGFIYSAGKHFFSLFFAINSHFYTDYAFQKSLFRGETLFFQIRKVNLILLIHNQGTVNLDLGETPKCICVIFELFLCKIETLGLAFISRTWNICCCFSLPALCLESMVLYALKHITKYLI